MFKSSQPFNAVGTGKLHTLHILQFLANTDKHQLLNIVANTQVDLGGFTVDPEPPGGVVSTLNEGVVAKGSVLARVEFARPTQPGKTEVTLKPIFAFEQVFRYVDQDGAEQWLVVGDALHEIGPDVVEAVGTSAPKSPYRTEHPWHSSLHHKHQAHGLFRVRDLSACSW